MLDDFSRTEIDEASTKLIAIQRVCGVIKPEIEICRNEDCVVVRQKYEDSFFFVDQLNAIDTITKLAVIIDYLHRNEIVHGDLSYKNLALERETGDVLIFDWEIFSVIMSENRVLLRSSKLSCHPEDQKAGRLSKKSDRYAFCNLIPQIIFGRYLGIKFADKWADDIEYLSSKEENVFNVMKSILEEAAK